MAKRRGFNVFSLSFLDVMSCGFGAVVLIFLIINHATEDDAKQINRDLLSESRKLDYEVDQGEKNLVDMQELLQETKKRVDQSRQQLLAMIDDLEDRKDQLDDLEQLTTAQRESVEELQSDIETREEDVERLQKIEQTQQGRTVVDIEGEGDRQYLTGLYMGGRNILIALDTSASMLDNTIVNVLRRRHMPHERKIAAPKWQRAVRTVEWLTAQLPLDSEFQIMTFNTEAASLFETDDWVATTEADAIEGAMQKLRNQSPDKGTSLQPLLRKIAQMDPIPDNVFLIVDGLPTQGDKPPRKPTVSGRDRMKHFNDAFRRLPSQSPFNVILFPMEGDPHAATAYWHLAQSTNGTYMAPSTDWP